MRTELRDDSGRLVGLETEPATAEDEAEATAAGLRLRRRIDQLRIDLPLVHHASIPATRPFEPGADDAAFLAVNNRAFEWHPDQSNWTPEDLHARMREPWFDPNGFLLLEIDGTLGGFCWTKIHPAAGDDPELGEIFVIAVDPAFHGRGLGRALTIAGLDHLAARSVHVGMLHVEHDNRPALALYRDLGFVHHDSHCWWSIEDGSTS